MKIINKNRVANNFNLIPEIVDQIEELKKNFSKKYNIDYLGINMTDSRSEYLFSRLDHDKWHEYYWYHDKVRVCPSLQQLMTLKNKEQQILFFQTYQTRTLTNIRAEIIGKASSGCSLLFSNEKSGNKIQFCITFKDNISIDKLNSNILMTLVADLNKIKGFLDPYMEYFINVGNLNHTKDLINFTDKKKMDLEI